MDTATLLKKVRKIEIKTRGLSNQIFSGEYHSAFKGRGMAFSEVREYMPGDEIRTIDWNVTARFNKPYVKVFEEERELTVMLLIDVSQSGLFGTTAETKQEIITEISAVLSFSAIQNNDKIGVIFFSDRIEQFIPPKKGRSHILRIIRELINMEPQGHGTDLNEALRFFTNVCKKRSTAFILSDFIADDFEDALKIANKKHDMAALHVYDNREIEVPSLGWLPITDLETGQEQWVDTSNKKVQQVLRKRAAQHQEALRQTLRRAGVDYARMGTHESYVRPLMRLFKQRGR